MAAAGDRCPGARVTTALITGARGFIGRNLALGLQERGGIDIVSYDHGESADVLRDRAVVADVVFHLAGVNRPESPEEFQIGNVDLTRVLTDALARSTRSPHLIFASSIQAETNNPYGSSKRAAELAITEYVQRTGAAATILRLKNVFGKWCRPNYNSVVATYCHNIARNLPIFIRDPHYEVELVHVDHVVQAMIDAMDARAPIGDGPVADTIPSTRISLQGIADTLHSFAAERETLRIPDLSTRFRQQLYGTFISYLEPHNLAYSLNRRADQRGDLAEFIKSDTAGQVFVSRTLPGITRGHHYHHTKIEKFLVIAGTGLIRMRHVENGTIIEFRVRGEDYRVVQIPPGHTHSIKNVGDNVMVTLFWASEIFDPDHSDTIPLQVDHAIVNAI